MKKIIYNDSTVLYFILTNVLVIYLHSFNSLSEHYFLFDIIDIVFTLFFTLELIIRISDVKGRHKLTSFLKDNWNKLDFFTIILALPSIGVLFTNNLEVFAGFTALRSLRIFKLFRIIEFIPNGRKISKQMFKAFKSITFIIFAFSIYSTIIALISVSLFKSSCPTYFSNAFDAFFTTFKIFSGDGFTDVVSEIELHQPGNFIYFTKIYFVFIVFTGSILGLSLINSIFMNEMSQIEEQIEDSENDLLVALQIQINELKIQNQQILDELKDSKQSKR